MGESWEHVPRVHGAPGLPLNSDEGMKAARGAELSYFIPKIKHSVNSQRII